MTNKTITGLTAAGALAGTEEVPIWQSGASVKATITGINALVTPTSLGLVIGTNVQAYDADLTTWAGITPGASVATALAVAVGTDGAFVVKGGALGTPSSGIVTNLTGTASININGTVGATTAAAGKFTTIDATGAFTSSSTISLSGLGTNAPIDIYRASAVAHITTISGLTTGFNSLLMSDSHAGSTDYGAVGVNNAVNSWGLGYTPSASALFTSVLTWVKSGAVTIPGTLGVTGVATLGNGAVLGTPASGSVTNLTGTASININGTVGATTPAAGTFTTLIGSSVYSEHKNDGWNTGNSITFNVTVAEPFIALLATSIGQYASTGTSGLYLVTRIGTSSYVTAIINDANLTVAVNGSDKIVVTNVSGGNRTLYGALTRMY
tara:strand:- start:250 stop:1395 length:1146 start_codon:yes stop_codon:yes gene_type:complete